MCLCLKSIHHKILKDANLYEKWCGRKPNVEHLRVFGSVMDVKNTKKVSKLEDASNVTIFIGCELGTKAYMCLDQSIKTQGIYQ